MNCRIPKYGNLAFTSLFILKKDLNILPPEDCFRGA